MSKEYTDNDIQHILRNTSDALSPRQDHFKKILASIDMDSSLVTREALRSKKVSPYGSIFTTYSRLAGAAFVAVLTLVGAGGYISSSKQGSVAVETHETPQNTVVDSPSGASNATTNTADVSTESLFAVAQNSNAPSVTSLRTAKTSVTLSTPEQQALGNSLSQELTADQLAADDLLAIAE